MPLLDLSSPELVSVLMFNSVCDMQQSDNFSIAPSKLNYEMKSYLFRLDVCSFPNLRKHLNEVHVRSMCSVISAQVLFEKKPIMRTPPGTPHSAHKWMHVTGVLIKSARVNAICFTTCRQVDGTIYSSPGQVLPKLCPLSASAA